MFNCYKKFFFNIVLLSAMWDKNVSENPYMGKSQLLLMIDFSLKMNSWLLSAA